MKLVCWNLAIKKNNTREVIDFLVQQDADIICLQEVADHKEDTANEMFKIKIGLDNAIAVKYPYRYFSPLWQAKGFTALDFGGFIEQGNYILSKFPLSNTENLFFHKKYEKISDWNTVKFHTEDHARALQVVEIQTDDRTFRLMNFHGIWTRDKMGDKRTIDEINFIMKKVQSKKMPTIVAGDFNLLPEAESIGIINAKMRNLILEGSHHTTRPDFKDNLETGKNIVDYIFVEDNIKVGNFDVLFTEISDHYPLIMEFEV